MKEEIEAFRQELRSGLAELKQKASRLTEVAIEAINRNAKHQRRINQEIGQLTARVAKLENSNNDAA